MLLDSCTFFIGYTGAQPIKTEAAAVCERNFLQCAEQNMRHVHLCETVLSAET